MLGVVQRYIKIKVKFEYLFLNIPEPWKELVHQILVLLLLKGQNRIGNLVLTNFVDY